MANERFDPQLSSDKVWHGEDQERCITDDLDTLESNVTALQNGKANNDHTHSGYASSNHTHTGYATSGHTHSEYAPMSSFQTALSTFETALAGKAASDHTHAGYAATEHSHSEYAGATHTHGQAEITGLSDALAGKAASSHTHAQTEITGLTDALAAKANVADMTAKADLVDGKVPASQLPAFVDDVLEYANMAAFPTAGESGKIYVDTDTNKTYRWGGTAYVEISSSIALGETAATAYRGDRGKTAYDHSQNSTVHVTTAQKTAWDSKAAGDHGHSYNDLSDKPTIPAAYTHPSTHPASIITGLAAVATSGSYNDLSNKPTIPTIPSSLPANGGNADTVDGKHASEFAEAGHTHTAASIGAAASSHTHTPASIGAAAASHTHTDNVLVQKASGPAVNLTVTGADCKTSVYKNANATADNGTTISDYASDGTRDSLIMARGQALTNKLRLVVDHGGDETATYAIYGEHHKPTAAEVGALPTTGGTVTGDVNVNGVLRVNGQQSFYFQTSTNSQTVGTNNATGGTTICCGANADVNVNGAHMKTATIVPKTNNVYMCGNATYRWAGIYSTAAVNVSSDERMKRDIATMDTEELARFVNCLEVKTFNYKDDAEDADARIGLIAQEVQGVNPDIAKFFVKEGEDGMLGLTSADLVFATIAALQEANKQIAVLKYKVAALEAHKCHCK